MKRRNPKRTYGADEVKRYLGVLKEHFADGVKAVAEQYFDLKKDIGKVQETQKSHTEMMGTMMEDVTVIKSDTEFLKAGLKKKVDYDEFVALEKRVSLVETKLRR